MSQVYVECDASSGASGVTYYIPPSANAICQDGTAYIPAPTSKPSGGSAVRVNLANLLILCLVVPAIVVTSL